MNKIFTHFYRHTFSYTVALLFFIVGIVSYNRFIVNRDYMVAYEGECNPNTESCFVICDDDACSQKHYYSKIQKYAPILYEECGEDITDCKLANECVFGDTKCSIVYCKVEVDGDVCSKSANE